MNPNVLEEEKLGMIEIKETLKKSYYTGVCCIIFDVFLLIIIVIAFNIMGKNLEETDFLRVIGAIILLVIGVVLIVLLIWIGFKMRGGRQERSFTIDEKMITFKTPNKPTFTVNLDAFNTVEVSRLSKQDIVDFFMSTYTTYYKFHFLEAAKSFIVQSQKDYSSKRLKKIRAVLEQFCQAQGKTYIFKK